MRIRYQMIERKTISWHNIWLRLPQMHYFSENETASVPISKKRGGIVCIGNFIQASPSLQFHRIFNHNKIRHGLYNLFLYKLQLLHLTKQCYNVWYVRMKTNGHQWAEKTKNNIFFKNLLTVGGKVCNLIVIPRLTLDKVK